MGTARCVLLPEANVFQSTKWLLFYSDIHELKIGRCIHIHLIIIDVNVVTYKRVF